MDQSGAANSQGITHRLAGKRESHRKASKFGYLRDDPWLRSRLIRASERGSQPIWARSAMLDRIRT